MHHTQTQTQTHPHLCIISVTSSHLFTTNLHLPLYSLALVVHRSNTVVVHIHLRNPQTTPLRVFSSFFSSSPSIELWRSLIFFHYGKPPTALYVLHVSEWVIVQSLIHSLTGSDAVHIALDLVLLFWKGIAQDGNVKNRKCTWGSVGVCVCICVISIYEKNKVLNLLG